jgi:hypothetical protein
MERLYNISQFIWLVATVFYAAGVLYVVLAVPFFGLAILFFGTTAAELLWATHLPVPILMVFQDTYGAATSPHPIVPVRVRLGNPFPEGYILCFIGLIGVTLSLSALWKVGKEKAWAWVLIALAVLAYLFSVLDAITGVCTVDGDFGGIYGYCQFGFLAAWPNFLASTVLLAAAIVIYRYTGEPRG